MADMRLHALALIIVLAVASARFVCEPGCGCRANGVVVFNNVTARFATFNWQTLFHIVSQFSYRLPHSLCAQTCTVCSDLVGIDAASAAAITSAFDWWATQTSVLGVTLQVKSISLAIAPPTACHTIHFVGIDGGDECLFQNAPMGKRAE